MLASITLDQMGRGVRIPAHQNEQRFMLIAMRHRVYKTILKWPLLPIIERAADQVGA